MAISRVQNVGKDGGSGSIASLALAYGSNVTAGNLLVVGQRLGGTPTSCTVTDTLTSTWHNLTFKAVSGVGAIQISWAFAASSGANTVTITPNVSVSLRMDIIEYSGAAFSNPLDAENNTQTATSTTPAATSITPAANNELVIGLAAVGGAETFTQNGSFNLVDQVPTGAGVGKMAMQDWIQTTATATTAPWTISSSDLWQAAIAVFKPFALGQLVPTDQPIAAKTGSQLKESLFWDPATLPPSPSTIMPGGVSTIIRRKDIVVGY